MIVNSLHMDHIPIFGKDKHEHDTRLKQVLGTLSQSDLTINPEKFDFSKRQLDYLGWCAPSVIVPSKTGTSGSV